LFGEGFLLQGERTLVMRWLTTFAILLIAFPAMGQRKDPWQDLSRLKSDDRIEVITASGGEKGEFVSSSTESLTIRAGGSEKRFERSMVMQVVSRSRSHRIRNILIGAGIGTAIAGVTDGTLGVYLRNESNPDNARALIWTLPIAAGVGLGAALPAHKTIYKR